MKSIMLLLLLLVGISEVTANAQIIKPAPFVMPTYEQLRAKGTFFSFNDQLAYWWWGYSLTQVRDKILSERGWQLDDPKADEVETILRATTEDGRVMLFFTFANPDSKNTYYLLRRAFAYPDGHPLISEWDSDLAKLPYDDVNSQWTDELTFAHIKRKYAAGYTMYTIECYMPEPKK